jgi:thymidylate kinase
MIKTCKKDISEEVFQMTMAANYIETLQKEIIPRIDAGQDVVMTRFLPSTLAY